MILQSLKTKTMIFEMPSLRHITCASKPYQILSPLLFQQSLYFSYLIHRIFYLLVYIQGVYTIKLTFKSSVSVILGGLVADDMEVSSQHESSLGGSIARCTLTLTTSPAWSAEVSGIELEIKNRILLFIILNAFIFSCKVWLAQRIMRTKDITSNINIFACPLPNLNLSAPCSLVARE